MLKFIGLTLGYLVVALVLTLSFVGFVHAGGGDIILQGMPPPVTTWQYGQSRRDYQEQQSRSDEGAARQYDRYQRAEQLDIQREQADTQREMLWIEKQRDRDAINYRYRAR